MTSAAVIVAAKTHPLTNRHLLDVFGVTTVTLDNYRKGSDRRPALPCKVVQVGASQRIFYKPKEVEAWAKKNNVKIKKSIDAVLDEKGVGVGRNGPKPGQAPAQVKKPQATVGKGVVRAVSKAASRAVKS